MGSRRLYYRVAARLRGLELETNAFEFSGLRAALYYDFMELEDIFARTTALLISRSAVMSSDSVDFQKQIENVVALRHMLDDKTPYLETSGATNDPESERQLASQKFMERAERILGKEQLQELLKNGK